MKARMEHLYRWQNQKGHKHEWEPNEERLERNERRRNEGLGCRYEGCDKVCGSRAGLVMHEKRMHRVAEERVKFACRRCGKEFESEGNRKNHEKTCTGGEYEDDRGRRQCGKCEGWYSKANYARHVRSCRGGGGGAGQPGRGVRERGVGAGRGRAQRGRRGACGRCGREMLAGNIPRHQRGGACRVWDPGGGGKPLTGADGP